MFFLELRISIVICLPADSDVAGGCITSILQFLLRQFHSVCFGMGWVRSTMYHFYFVFTQLLARRRSRNARSRVIWRVHQVDSAPYRASGLKLNERYKAWLTQPLPNQSREAVGRQIPVCMRTYRNTADSCKKHKPKWWKKKLLITFLFIPNKKLRSKKILQAF